MNIKQGFVVKNVGEQSYVVATGELVKSFKGMIRLNQTGRLLWDMIAEGNDADTMVTRLTDKYDVSEENARRDVEAFIKVLADKGILE